jgi:hypothetical protein
VGYDVRATEASLRISAKSEGDALGALRRLNGECDPRLKRGGTVDEDGKEHKWFSWMREDFSEYEGLGDVLDDMGFAFMRTEDWYVVTGWTSEKRGQEDLLMEALAPWVEPGSYVDWVGEDCRRYRWEFADGRMLVRDGVESWSSDADTPTRRRLREIAETDRYIAARRSAVEAVQSAISRARKNGAE